MGRQIFISHASEDSSIAEGLCRRIEAGGWSCWLAPRDVAAGQPWIAQVTKGIETCEILLVLITPASDASSHVANEVHHAINCSMPVIAVRLDGCEPSGDLAFLLNRHHQLTVGRRALGQDGFDAVRESIRPFIAATYDGPNYPEVAPRAAEQHGHKRAPRPVVLAAGGMLLATAITAILIGYLTFRSDATGPASVPLSVSSVSVAEGHACALNNDTTVDCWGWNPDGQLGTGDEFDSATPKQVLGLDGATFISSGESSSCAVLLDATVDCWGNVGANIVPDPNVPFAPSTVSQSAVPVTIEGIRQAVTVGVGSLHACVLLETQTVKCWGSDQSGQRGTAGIDETIEENWTPTEVSFLEGVSQLTVGAFHNCALLVDDTARCWGANRQGQLGNVSTEDQAFPVPVVGLGDATKLSAGFNSTCAIREDRKVACWGADLRRGQADGQSQIVLSEPTVIDDLDDIVDVSVGLAHACAVRADGKVLCWGSNRDGRLGTGNTDSAQGPEEVTDLEGVVSVSAGGFDTCATTLQGELHCWGLNRTGSTGEGTTAVQATPHLVSEVNSASEPESDLGSVLAASVSVSGTHACAVTVEGQLYCWGDNEWAQLGQGDFLGRPWPTLVQGLSPVTSVATSSVATCAVQTDNSVSCWGSTGWGEYLVQPTQINGLPPVTAITLGSGMNCALALDARVFCWSWGEDEYWSEPTEVPGLSGVTELGHEGGSFGGTCALLEDSSVRCWTADDPPGTFYDLGGFTGVKSLALGDSYDGYCVITQERTLACAPNRDAWIAGDLALRFESLDRLTQADPDCAVGGGPLDSGQIVQCWGWWGTASTPERVPGLSNAVMVSTALSSACAVHDEGRLSCWGRNMRGMLGIGTVPDQPEPVQVLPRASP